jgi:hypothetical protein
VAFRALGTIRPFAVHAFHGALAHGVPEGSMPSCIIYWHDTKLYCRSFPAPGCGFVVVENHFTSLTIYPRVSVFSSPERRNVAE